MSDLRDSAKLTALIAEARAQVDAMSAAQVAEMLRYQAASWARAESSWPRPRFKMVNGVKVYESYEDYCND